VREGRALSLADDTPSALTLPKGKPHSGNIVIVHKGKRYAKAYLRVFRIFQKTSVKNQDWFQGYIAIPKGAIDSTRPPAVYFGLKKIDQKINLVFDNIEEVLIAIANLYSEVRKLAPGVLKAHMKEMANWRKLNKKYFELYSIPFRDKSGKSASQLDFDFMIYYDAINTENTR
jgi:hypothetical protein